MLVFLNVQYVDSIDDIQAGLLRVVKSDEFSDYGVMRRKLLWKFDLR